ncbi:lipoprotein [Spiroplasma ixodetis]|uniref:lipoprotein n=1 Tax=Spiroplasma ixodetis TaxID=2141 RepID=UPI0025788344|nr:lipoprotein [Spiroplasma ixodetis]WJG69935.1 hypothetical protein SIXOD_v1c09290 [Spiroplasma ixodetis Y32]
MRKILSLLGAILFSTTTSASIIACDSKEKPNEPPQPIEIRLNEQVSKDLKLTDSNNKSLVGVKINALLSPDHVEWDFEPDSSEPSTNKIKKLKASILLKPDNEAVSQESEYFLINTLKLIKDSQNKFNRTDADSITVSASEISPILSKKQDNSDYIVTDGNFKLQFMKGIEKLGDNYTIDLKKDSIDIIKPVLDFWSVDIESNPFNEELNSKFKVGENNDRPVDGSDIFNYLKNDGMGGHIRKKIQSLKNLINKGDNVNIKVSGREVTASSTNWEIGNKLIVKIYFDTIYSEEMKLTLR